MRLLISIIAFASASGPCEDLCAFDGPERCPNGSWSKGVVCHGYVYRGDPSVRNYCYHTAATAATCPAGGEPVRPQHVAGLIMVGLESHAGPVPDRFAHYATAPSTPTRRPRDEGEEVSAPWAPRARRSGGYSAPVEPMRSLDLGGASSEGSSDDEGPYIPRPPQIVRMPFLDGMIGIREVFGASETAIEMLEAENVCSRLAGMLTASRRGETVEYKWIQGRGERLLGRVALAGPEGSSYTKPLLMLLGEICNELGESCNDFMERHGITRVLRANTAAIRAWTVRYHEMSRQGRFLILGLRGTAQLSGGFAAFLSLVMPWLMDLSEIRNIVFDHRVFRLIISNSIENGQSDLDILRVSRANAFEESIPFLTGDVAALNQGSVTVEFNLEEGQGGGVMVDWLTEVTSQCFGSHLFSSRMDTQPNYLEISPVAAANPANRNHYKAAGRFMALALTSENPLGVNFPIMFWARLLDQNLRVADIQQDESELYRSLRYIESLSSDAELAAYEIEIQGVAHAVTLGNRRELIDQKVNSLISDQVAESFEQIRQGFFDIIPQHVFHRSINAMDIQDLLRGSPSFTSEDFIAHVNLVDYEPEDEQIQWLVRLIDDLTGEERKRLLRFITGSYQLPVGGFGALSHPVVIRRTTDIHLLPTSATCAFQMNLPAYATEETFRRNVVLALNSDAAMGVL